MPFSSRVCGSRISGRSRSPVERRGPVEEDAEMCLCCGHRQEGWRLENEDPSDPSSPLVFKGVVFNEMKGAFVSSTHDSPIYLRTCVVKKNTDQGLEGKSGGFSK